MHKVIYFHGAHGLRLAASDYGNEEGPTVLFLHGGGQTRHAWDASARALAERGYRAIALDGRGHGNSDWDAERRYQLNHFVDDLEAVLAQLDAPPAVVGASLGGLTALVANGLRELPLAALVLVDIAPRMESMGVERVVDFMSRYTEGFASLDEVADAIASYQPHRRRPRDLAGLEKNLRRAEDGRWYWHWDPRILDNIFEATEGEGFADADQAARNLSIPTLLVRGALSDLTSEESARHFLELAPHAEQVDVSGAAHMVAGDKNDRFTAAVARFLERCYPA